MFVKVAFITKTGLGSPYSYKIDKDQCKGLKKNDYVVVTSARTDYTVGICVGLTEEAPAEDVKLQSFVIQLPVDPYVELDLNSL